ncbi:MAG: transposase [Acidobacteria bacterium]|nr:transposase [Acidobacteriota bacterium]
MKVLRQIPCIGPIRAALLLALMQTPHRFRSKRQLWTYSGLGVETHDSATLLSGRTATTFQEAAASSWFESKS